MKATDNFFSSKHTWSRLKDQMLASYLRPYLTKITHTGYPIKIADCFAGKGYFDDGEPGSPIYIASAIKEAKARSSDSNIQGIFIEKKYCEDLEKNLESYSNCKLLKGDYEERVQNFVKLIDNPNLNLLLYVDPYGIKHLAFKHFEDVKDMGLHSYELLLNFNTFGFLREGCRLLKLRDFECDQDSEVYEPDDANTIERMNAIAHGNYWQIILKKFHLDEITMFEAEGMFSTEYLNTMKTIFSYVINIPIKQKLAHLPKYRLIFGTNSEDGLLLMADSMSRAWKRFVEENRSGQKILFDELDFPDNMNFGNQDVNDVIWELLQEPLELKILLVKMIEIFGIAYSESELISFFRRLEKEEIITVKRIPPTTPTGLLPRNYNYKDYRITVKRD